MWSFGAVNVAEVRSVIDFKTLLAVAFFGKAILPMKI
jgi:hypothetical protein